MQKWFWICFATVVGKVSEEMVQVISTCGFGNGSERTRRVIVLRRRQEL